MKTIGWKISESLGLPSQAGIEDAPTTYDAHIISSQGRRCKKEDYKYTLVKQSWMCVEHVIISCSKLETITFLLKLYRTYYARE